MVSESEADASLRVAAFSHVQNLVRSYGPLPWSIISEGFFSKGETVSLAGRATGIFKPRQMENVLSIKTVLPRSGRRVWYDDQRQVHEQIISETESFEYAFTGTDPNHHDNQGLRRAHELGLPLIYFLATAPGICEAILPVFIADWSASERKAKVVVGSRVFQEYTLPDDASERRYALRQVKQRLHQSRFRAAVLEAYGGRCALSGFPEHRLLDAAHIIDDGHETLGQPIVSNGLPLTKIHHAAFDAHLIGIDADLRLHVSPRLLGQKDGPVLAALNDLHGMTLRRPLRPQDAPDRDRLAHRFEEFRNNVGA